MFLLEKSRGIYMGQGSFVIAEWDSLQKKNSAFQMALRDLDLRITQKCNTEWAPKTLNLRKTFAPDSNNYGRTTILPALFSDHNGVQLGGSWRQLYTVAGNQTILTGTRAGNTIPEDFKIAWAGLAFPNKQQHFTEFKWQIGDRKYGRINVEEMHSYNKPAIIFEEGLILDEEESFDLYAYLEGGHGVGPGGDIAISSPFILGIYQSVVMLGAAYFKVTSKVLGNCGAAI